MKIQLSDHFTYKKLIRFVFPTIVMMIFTSIYGVVDGLFVSNFVGKTPFAALNLVMPFVMILGGMGFMIGTGGSALVAMELGCGRKEQACQTFTILIIFTVILGALLSVLGMLAIRPVSRFLGATDAMMEDCVVYGRTVIAFTGAFMLQNVFQSFLAAAEKPKLGLTVTVIAGLCNGILDAVFIAGFRWGLAGAALATGIGQCVGGLLPLLYFLRPNSSLLCLTKTRFRLKPVIKACANGSSEVMSSVSSSTVSMLYNFQLLRLIGEAGVSAYGVLMYVQFIFIAISIGYSIGSGPIISYHYGAGNHAELKNMLRKSALLMFGSGVLLTGLAVILSAPLAKIFVGYDADLYRLTTHAFHLFASSFLLAGFNLFASGFFTALNNGKISAAISFLRALVFQAASVIILPVFLGVDGIWLAITVAEICACIISVGFLAAKKNTYHY
ncbi:MAG: MATE family efflux transporter [Dorea sp.]|jgi:putative MATE family efflux protein|nr:MATE family efflux transporter [Dorea sp.]